MSTNRDPRHLPRAAVDHGDHIEVGPTGGSRVLSAIGGGVFVALGLAVMILGPGDFDTALPRFGIGALLLAIGMVVLVVRTTRLRLDAEGIAQRSLLRSRSLTWDQVSELAVDEHLERGGPLGSFTRRVGFLSVSAGPGGRRGTGVGVSQTQRVVRLEARAAATDGAVSMELDGADLDEGYALVHELRDRSWLPDEVEVRTG